MRIVDLKHFFNRDVAKFIALGLKYDKQGYYVIFRRLSLRDRLLILFKGVFFIRFLDPPESLALNKKE